MPRSPTIDPLSAQNAHSVARGLGWFSIGLGLAEILAPRALTRGLGMEGHEQIVRAYGVREIATGIGILSSTHPVPWIWGRVGGDALDIATLATGLQQDNPKKENVELALVAVAGVTALDVVCGASLARHSLARHSSPKLRRRRPAIDYHRRTGFPKPPEQMRGAARDFEVPRDMRTPEALRPFPTIPIRSDSDGRLRQAALPSKVISEEASGRFLRRVDASRTDCVRPPFCATIGASRRSESPADDRTDDLHDREQDIAWRNSSTPVLRGWCDLPAA